MRGKFLATVCAVSGVTIAATGAAFAGGYVAPVVEETPIVVEPTPVSDWAGAYAGGSLGYSFGGDDEVGLEARDPDGNSLGLAGNLGDVDMKGVTAGLHGGYRWQRGNWVFGPELGIEGGSVDGSTELAGFDGAEMESSLNYLVGLKMKTGYAFNPQTLVYGTFGVAHGDFDYELSRGDESVTESFSDTGLTAGLGVERKLNDKLSMFAEWEYRHFENTDVSFDAGEAGSLVTAASPSHHNVKVGVNYRF